MKRLLLAILICLPILSPGQISYTLSTFSEGYAPITEGTILSEPGWDDAAFVASLGFLLDIGGDPFSNYLQSGDGSLLGILSSSGSIAVFGLTSDFIDGGIVPDAEPSIISALLDGPVGNRIYKLQFESVAFFNEVQGDVSSSAQRMNFQYWFYEVDNSIEIRFGQNSITEPQLLFDGEDAPLIYFLVQSDGGQTFDYFVQLSGSSDDPILADVSNGEFAPTLSEVPENGRVYRLAPPSLPVSVGEINKPVVAVYPNPATKFIRISGLESLPTNARIFDITGREVWSGLLNAPNTEINIESLSQGVFILNLELDQRSIKFVKR